MVSFQHFFYRMLKFFRIIITSIRDGQNDDISHILTMRANRTFCPLMCVFSLEAFGICHKNPQRLNQMRKGAMSPGVQNVNPNVRNAKYYVPRTFAKKMHNTDSASPHFSHNVFVAIGSGWSKFQVITMASSGYMFLRLRMDTFEDTSA